MDTINSRLQAVREKLKMNVSEFARHVGIDRSRYAKMETGPNKPAMDAIEAIAAKIADLDLRWLLTGVGRPFDLSDQEAINQAGRLDRKTWNQKYKNLSNAEDEPNVKPSKTVAELQAELDANKREGARLVATLEAMRSEIAELKEEKAELRRILADAVSRKPEGNQVEAPGNYTDEPAPPIGFRPSAVVRAMWPDLLPESDAEAA